MLCSQSYSASIYSVNTRSIANSSICIIYCNGTNLTRLDSIIITGN